MSMRTLARALTLNLVLPMLAGFASEACSVAVNGVPIAGAEARPDVTVNIVEVREGGSDLVRLAVGLKRYAISIVSRDPIAVFDSQLPVAATPVRFSIRMDDGRTFGNCLVAGLTSEGTAGTFRLIYALRCEDVTP